MTDIHIDDFYKDVGKVLISLYNSFPVKTALYVEDISGPDNPDEFGLHSDRFMATLSTMIWLAENKYILYDSLIRQEALDMAVLTEKAFLLLCSRSELELEAEDYDDAVNREIHNLESNIHHLRVAIKSLSSKRIQQCVSYLLNKSRDFKDHT